LGCTVIELLTGNPPYFDLMQYPALFRIVQDEHPPLPEVPEDCRDFLLRCFKKQPEERETAGQLIRHRWLEDVN
jgi:serine/threonine protein kinase